MRRQTSRIAVLLLTLLLTGPLPAQEARQIRYATTLVPTGVEALDGPLEQASRLRRLAEDAPVDAHGLVARALGEPAQLDQVLQAEGFWGGRVEVRIAGEPAATPGLAERLAESRRAEVPVEVRVIPGPRYRLRQIALRPASPAEAPAVRALGEPAGINPGDPARAGPVLDAESALLGRLRDTGHPLATVADREVVVDHATQSMDVTWTLAPGPAARFARPEVTGTDAVNPALLARVVRRLEGAPYSPATQERTRRDLAALGAFDSVRARAADRLDEAGRLPVTFRVTDRPRNAAGFNLAYETNYGPSGLVYYERRNVFGNAELLRLEASISRVGETGTIGTSDVNSRIGATLRQPGLLDGRTTLVSEVAAVRERLDAYDRDVFVASSLLERPFGERWVLQTGPTFETGRVGRDGAMDPVTLLGLVLGARYDGADSLLDPRRGFRLNLTAIPYADLLDGGGFVRTTGTLRTYIDVTGDGGSVLALRGTLGSLVGGDGNVPLDKRFYAGGGGSVRGYAYQSIGPRDSQGRPDGGASLVEGSLELRQRIRGPIGMVAFVDAGSVGLQETPSFSDVRVGAGVGVRYATGIGPLRVDVAVPLNRQPGDSAYGLYVGLGQAF